MEKCTRFVPYALLLGLLVMGCDTTANPEDIEHVDETNTPYEPSTVIGDDPPDGLRVGVFTVCKSAPDDTNHAFPFEVTAQGPNVDRATVVSSIELVDDTCADVYKLTEPSADADEVTVTENVPVQWRLDSLIVHRLDSDGTVTSHEPAGPAITERIAPNTRGVLAIYHNGRAPAPSRGGEGCTPGAWKNRLLRLQRWPVPAETRIDEVWNVPESLAEATLLDALRFGGGPTFEHKVRILLRAATAAYLNALAIAYDRTAEQVVDAVNTAIVQGEADAVITLAEELDGLNNQECPITERNYDGE